MVSSRFFSSHICNDVLIPLGALLDSFEDHFPSSVVSGYVALSHFWMPTTSKYVRAGVRLVAERAERVLCNTFMVEVWHLAVVCHPSVPSLTKARLEYIAQYIRRDILEGPSQTLMHFLQ